MGEIFVVGSHLLGGGEGICQQFYLAREATGTRKRKLTKRYKSFFLTVEPTIVVAKIALGQSKIVLSSGWKEEKRRLCHSSAFGVILPRGEPSGSFHS